MCNRYANTVPYTQYVKTFRELRLPVVSPAADAAPNLEPLENIAPTDYAPVLRSAPGGLELKMLRWGLIPAFHRGAMKDWAYLTTNARFETLRTTRTFQDAYARRRCLVPVSHFYEWTGTKGKKVKWSFARRDEDWFCFAGIWDRAETKDGVIESYALVTTAAGPDVAPYHDRQPVLLERSAYVDWLREGLVPESALKAEPGLLTARASS